MPNRNVRALITILLLTAAGLLYFSKEFKTNRLIGELASIIRRNSLENCSLKNCTALLNYNAKYIIEEGDFEPNVIEEVLELQELAAEDLKVKDELSFLDVINIEYEHNHVEVEGVVADRMKRIKEHCNKTFHNYNRYNMYNFPEANALWIPSFKSGSSTWRDFFIETINPPFGTIKNFHLDLLAKRRLKETDYTKSAVRNRRKLRDGRASKNPRPISFMQVRHPIDRLISLHLSTSITRTDLATLRIWGVDAIVGHRPIPDISKKRQYENELRTYVREKSDGKKISKFSEENPYFYPPHPTFSELISLVIHRRSANGHWMPATEWGDVCQHNLDYIIKLENNPMETIFLLAKLKLLEKEGYLLHKHNVSYGNKSVEVVAKQETFKDTRALHSSKYDPWMEMLNRQQKDSLKQMFKDDFYLYGYDNSMLN